MNNWYQQTIKKVSGWGYLILITCTIFIWVEKNRLNTKNYAFGETDTTNIILLCGLVFVIVFSAINMDLNYRYLVRERRTAPSRLKMLSLCVFPWVFVVAAATISIWG
jgi:hypothetical protein